MAFFHALFERLTIFDDAGLYHLPKEVVTFPGTLADTGKDRESVVLFRDIVNKFLDKDGLAYTGSSEKSDLTTLKIRFEKVNDFNTGIKNFLGCLEVFEFRRFSVNREFFFSVQITKSVDRFSYDIKDSASYLWTYRHFDRFEGVRHLHTSTKAICRVHGNGSYGILTDMLLNFHDKVMTIWSLHHKCVVDAWKVIFLFRLGQVEMYVYDRTDNL